MIFNEVFVGGWCWDFQTSFVHQSALGDFRVAVGVCLSVCVCVWGVCPLVGGGCVRVYVCVSVSVWVGVSFCPWEAKVGDWVLGVLFGVSLLSPEPEWSPFKNSSPHANTNHMTLTGVFWVMMLPFLKGFFIKTSFIRIDGLKMTKILRTAMVLLLIYIVKNKKNNNSCIRCEFIYFLKGTFV